jgi:DNA-binding transcriptional MerR regulator
MIGIHPNTLRLYEATGYIAPVGREANGYRSFAAYHIVQARIARLSGKLTWMSGPIRELTLANIRLCRDFACERALATLGELDRTLASEQKLAEEAVRAVERFRRKPGQAVEDAVPRRLLRVGEAARLLSLSADRIRDWERNGLILIPREEPSRYRLLGDEEIDRLRIIRLCRQAGYSISAIRRSLRALDFGHRGPVARLIDTPDRDETAIFPVFPTDRWLSTLRDARGQVRIILSCVEELSSLSP